MNYSQLKALLKINILFMNPQITGNLRKKGKQTNQLVRSILRQYLMMAILFLGIYGFTMFLVDFKKMAYMYTYYMGLFLIIAFSQGVSNIYNIFFESKDLEAYLPLPFGQKEIFLSKFLIILLGILPFILPIVLLFCFGYWRGGIIFPLSMVLALVSFFIFTLLVLEICSVAVFGLLRIPYFQTHKKQLSSILLIGSTVSSIGGVLLMTYNNNSQIIEKEGMRSQDPISMLAPFYWLTVEATSIKGIVTFLSFLVLVYIGYLVIQKWMMPKLYDQMIGLNSHSESKKKFKKSRSLRAVLVKYNSRLFDDVNLLLIIIVNSFIIPITLMVSFGVSRNLFQGTIPAKYGLLFLIGGFLFSCLMVSASSFVAVILSVDRENFLYIRSLPLRFTYYLKVKFFFALTVQELMISLICLLSFFIFHLSFVNCLMIIIGASVGTYLLCEFYFWRDYRLLEMNWTNVSQLFTRGSGTMGMMLNMFASIIVGGIVLLVLGIGLTFLPPIIIWIPTIFIFVGLVIFIHYYFVKKYWSTIE